MVFVLHWLPLSCGNRSQILMLWLHIVLFHPIDKSLSKLDLFSNSLILWNLREINVSLIWSYFWQEIRKWSSVSTSFYGQCAHSLSSLKSQFCLRQSFSIARLGSLSLYIVKVFLYFGSVQWSGILPLCTLYLGPNNILVCSVFL